MTTWTTLRRGDSLHTTACGRGCVEKIGSRYEVTVDGEKLAYGARTRKPYRYVKLGEAKQAAQDMLETGTFASPTKNEPKYKTYNPEVEGYGNAAQWQAIFESAMGPLGEVQTPELTRSLGVPADASWAEIKKAYRQQLLRCHPDQGGDPAAFQAAVAAFEALEARRAAAV
jgi:hypothetical protein